MSEASSECFIPINKIRNFKNNEVINDISKKETDFSENENKINEENEKGITNFNEIICNNIFQENILLKTKPFFYIPINEIKNENIKEKNKNREIICFEVKDKENNINNMNIKNDGKPIFYIPVENIKKEFGKVEESTINNQKSIKKHKNNNVLNYQSDNKINQNLNSNIFNGINNNLFSNFLNNIGYSNLFNSNINNNSLIKLIEKKAKFQIMKELGISALKNPNNVNHYLYEQIKNLDI